MLLKPKFREHQRPSRNLSAMNNRRWRPLLYAALGLIAVWVVAWAAYSYAQSTRMTQEKLRAYVIGLDLAKLSAADRERALRELADKVNALTAEDRRLWRRGDEWKKLFESMTEEERLRFIDATLPTGFKQMLDAFAAQPEEKRKALIDDAIKRMQESQPPDLQKGPTDYGSKGPPPLSPELEKEVRRIGLTAYYSQSSAETKAELAPLVEEIQRQMQRHH